ncbi:MAG: hypothetical protein IJU76_06410, partial [Desulfovibrionaceae bacterium]|nr:hypothetical protein [Desulfovibrionaceae bacterium]
DFAFGLYRTATPEENATEGWERVLDILDVSGDENLGGEHLLDLLAYEVVRAKCENPAPEKRLSTDINVQCPTGLHPFPNSELVFADTLEAHANTVNLREKLRPLWEEGTLADDQTNQISVTMSTSEGKTNNVTFDVDEDRLLDCLRQRIRKGVQAFFVTFKQAFKINVIQPQELHILLAGNSCKSPLVREMFEDVISNEPKLNKSEKVSVHYEMLVEDKEKSRDISSPTLKSGVALGLLRLIPGESTGIVERNIQDESPFLFTVGTFKNDFLEPTLPRNANYGEWLILSKVFRNGWTLLGYSDSPLAMENKIARTQCREHKINWGKDNFGRTIFIKAVNTHQAAIALGSEEDDLPDETTLHILNLKN